MFTLHQTLKNLKLFFIGLGLGLILLTVELFHLSQYGERFTALKHQHELTEKIINTDLNDPQMAAILLNTDTAEIELAVKKTGNEAILDLLITDGNEQATLLESLQKSSENFRNSVMTWSESLQVSRASTYQKMLQNQAAYQRDINALMVFHAQLLTKSIELAKYTIFTVLPLAIFLLSFFVYRLNQMYFDIKQAGSVDIDGSPKEMKTKEIDFLVKRLSRKSGTGTSSANSALINPQSNLLNERGMINTFNAKRSGKSANTFFIALFDIDQSNFITKELTKEERNGIYRKLGEIFSLYEHPNDVIAQLDDDRFVFLLSRNTKDSALSEVQKVVESVKDSIFTSSKGVIKLTFSAGFLLKPPAKSLDEIIVEAGKLLQIAQESGGNRVAQQRPKSDSYN